MLGMLLFLNPVCRSTAEQKHRNDNRPNEQRAADHAGHPAEDDKLGWPDTGNGKHVSLRTAILEFELYD